MSMINIKKHGFILLAALLVIGALSIGQQIMQTASAYTIKPACTDSLQDQIDAAAPGSIINVRTDCIYREQLSINKAITLQGQGGAEIRGSDLLTGWTETDGTWVSQRSIPSLYRHGDCEPGISRCSWVEQVFIDGIALDQVAAVVVVRRKLHNQS